MRRFFGLVVLLLVMSTMGCAFMSEEGAGAAPATVSSMTHAEFLEQALRESELPALFGKSDRIVLASFEDSRRGLPVNFLVEDVLVEKLVRQGFQVLERDPRALVQLTLEQSPGLLAAHATAGVSPEELRTLRLQGATRVLGYRVLRFGLRFLDGPTYETAVRVANIEILLRSIDVETGIVRATGVLRHEQKDTLRRSEMDSLGYDDNMIYYKDLPNQQGLLPAEQ